MSSKYGKIKTADELEKAILYIKAEQKATGRNISNEASRLSDSLTPVNLISTLVPTDILTDAGLGLVHGLKRRYFSVYRIIIRESHLPSVHTFIIHAVVFQGEHPPAFLAPFAFASSAISL